MPQASVSTTPVLFSTDVSFREWSEAFPTGFVLNLRANLSADYIILHRPTCRHIVYPYDAGALTERDYRKVGGLTVTELAGWISDNIPDARCITAACKSCAPTHDEADLVVSGTVSPFDTTAEDARTRVLRSIVERRGQAKFRSALVEAYSAKCAITGCQAIAVLEAAHIMPYRGDHSDDVRNGLLLRSDMHTLFDLRLLWIDEQMCVVISQDLESTAYRELDGKPLTMPASCEHWPSRRALKAHRETATKAILVTGAISL